MIQSRGRWWQNTRLCGYYARAAAAVLVAIGLAGITGILSWQFPSGVYHVAVASSSPTSVSLWGIQKRYARWSEG